MFTSSNNCRAGPKNNAPARVNRNCRAVRSINFAPSAASNAANCPDTDDGLTPNRCAAFVTDCASTAATKTCAARKVKGGSTFSITKSSFRLWRILSIAQRLYAPTKFRITYTLKTHNPAYLPPTQVAEIRAAVHIFR